MMRGHEDQLTVND